MLSVNNQLDSNQLPPLVTVIIPAYNHANYIAQTIRSIWQQDYCSIELIVMNDGSTDNTAAVINALLPDSPIPMRLINKTNSGIANTLNQAAELANGEYLFLLGSDDVALPHAIATLVQIFIDSTNNNLAITFGDNNYINSASKNIMVNSQREIASYSDNTQFSTFLSYFFATRPRLNNPDYFLSYESFLGGNYLPNGILIKKSILLEIGGYDENFLQEDHDLFLRLTKKYSLCYLPKVLASYRLHPTNLTTTSKQKLRLSHLRLLLREKKYCMQNLHLKLVWYKSYLRCVIKYFLVYRDLKFLTAQPLK
jgi:alpha-1,3-rhamnosyltransferase